MALTKITDATVEPVTLAEAREDRRIDDSASDATLTRLIKAARTTAENRLQRTLINTTWRLLIDFFPDAIKLPMPRVISVSGVQYVDADGALQTLSSSLYSVDSASEPGWIVPAYGLIWPGTRDQINAVSVVYTAGYGATAASVPDDIKSWILLAIGEMYENRERSAEKPVVPHGFVDGLLDTYRIVGI